MRFAFAGYGHGADPRLVGGQQGYLRRLASFLTSQGHHVDFLVLSEGGGEGGRVGARAEVHCYHHFADMAARLETGPYSYVQLSRFPPKCYPPLVRYLKGRRRGVRHGYLYLVMPPSRAMRLVRMALFKLFYDLVIAVSPRLLSPLKRWGINSFLLLPPIPGAYFQAGASRDSNREEILTVAYLGRIAADKGVQYLIEAFSQLEQRHEQVRPMIYGYYCPSSRASLGLHHCLEGQKGVEYAGVPYTGQRSCSLTMEDEVLPILRATDILVLPYQSVAGVTLDVPMLLLEAMAAGCVVVTTAVGDLPAILGDDELIVRDGTIFETVSRLIDGGMIKAKGEALRQRAIGYGVDMETTGRKFLAGLSLD